MEDIAVNSENNTEQKQSVFARLKTSISLIKSPRPLALLAVLLIAVAIPLTSYIAQQQQDIRQRASEPSIGNPKEITFVGSSVTVDPSGNWSTSSPTVQIQLTSPYPNAQGSFDMSHLPQPVFSENFSPAKHSWDLYTFNWWYGHYNNDAYELGINKLDTNPFYTTNGMGLDYGFIDGNGLPTNQWTALFDARLEGDSKNINRAIGVSFGTNGHECKAARDQANCYIVLFDTIGTSTLKYRFETRLENVQTISTQKLPFPIALGTNYTFRIDHASSLLKVWISTNNGANWQQYATFTLDPAKAQGNSFGFSIWREGGTTDSVVKGTFDNLKVWKIGDVPEPSGGNSFVRYAWTREDISNDSNGIRVQWQPYTGTTTLSQTFSSDPGPKTFCAQFKDANNAVGQQIYCSTINLSSGTAPTATIATPTTTAPSRTASYSKCGKSGILASGYRPITTCPPGTYLVVETSADYVQPTCRVVPPGFSQDPSNVCRFVANSTTPNNICLQNAGYSCGDANGKTRGGQTCTAYHPDLNEGCGGNTGNVYPYCFSSCSGGGAGF